MVLVKLSSYNGFIVSLNNKKIPLIPPLYYDISFITDFKEKAELFNSFFSKQCSVVSNNSSLPNYINYTTEKRPSTVALSVEAIGLIYTK